MVGEPAIGVAVTPTGGVSPWGGIPPSATAVVGVAGKAVLNKAFILK